MFLFYGISMNCIQKNILFNEHDINSKYFRTYREIVK